jgi:predicted XRE-type DNA-binding protein
MEPKDLKNSEVELSGAHAEPETVNDQVVAEEPAVQVEATVAEEVESPVAEAVNETVESVVPEATEPEAEPVAEEVNPEVADEPVTKEVENTVVGEEIPSIEELIDVSEEELLAEEELEEESSKKAKVADYASLSELELINILHELLERDDFEGVKEDIDAIKLNFFRLYRASIEAQKAAFIEAGGKLEDFKAESDPYELDLRNLLKKYQDKRNEHSKRAEEIKEENLRKKYEIIEEIKALINNKESINKTFQDFRDLQNKWREIGSVPQAKLKDLWDTYHHHVENFYDFIKINKELRDLDLKKNLEAKIDICEKAEELLVEPSIIKAFNVLQKYHEQWREVGPVPRDKKDELWERFKAATSIINKKHQDYFEGRKNEQKKNLDAKIALCEKVEEIANMEIDSHRDWDDKSKELIELQKVWRTIGFAPKKDNNKIYERFRLASDKFFDRKREFYNQNKEEQGNNLQLKTDLCVQAEALKDSTDWKKTADEFIAIQKAWKEIGPVPRKYSDAIWKRFRAACDYFFENKAKHFSAIDTEQAENLRLKKELLEEVKQFALTGDDGADLDKLKDFQRRFTEIGHVPFKEKDAIQNEFREVINKHFDTLRVDERRRNLMKFKNKVANNTSTGKGLSKNRFEREKYMTKLKQLETDLALLDNNIGFFANTKNASALIDDVNQKIASTKEKIEFLKEKIRIMDAMEDDE